MKNAFVRGQENPKITRTSAQITTFPPLGCLGPVKRRCLSLGIFGAEKSMFSIFEYLRKRTCDSVLAGVYDAMEMIEPENPDTLNLAEGEIPPEKFPPPQTPSPDGASPPKKIMSAPASKEPSAAGDLLSKMPGSTGPLPPRKRGRPRKNPPEGSGQ